MCFTVVKPDSFSKPVSKLNTVFDRIQTIHPYSFFQDTKFELHITDE